MGAFLFLLCLAASAAATERVRVAYVVDGDTVVLTDHRTVRLVGINAPEIGHDGAADEPLARAARAQLRRWLQDRTLTLVMGQEERDHYGRVLAELRLDDGRDVDELMLEAGLASLVAIPPNLDGLARHAAAEDNARAAGRGIWTVPYTTPIAASAMAGRATGFHFVRGRVRRVFRGDRDIYLYLAPDFAVKIAQRDWRHFHTDPDAYRDVDLIVAGWVTQHEGRYRVRIGHPAMLRLAACTPDPRLPGVRTTCTPHSTHPPVSEFGPRDEQRH